MARTGNLASSHSLGSVLNFYRWITAGVVSENHCTAACKWRHSQLHVCFKAVRYPIGLHKPMSKSPDVTHEPASTHHGGVNKLLLLPTMSMSCGFINRTLGINCCP